MYPFRALCLPSGQDALLPSTWHLATLLPSTWQFVKPSTEAFVLPTKAHADIVVPRGIENTVAIELIAQHINQVLVQREVEEEVELRFGPQGISEGRPAAPPAQAAQAVCE